MPKGETTIPLLTSKNLPKKEGHKEGRQEGETAVILRLLHKRLGDIPEEAQSKISKLSLTNLEILSDALLEFATVMDLQTWLDNR